MINYKKGVFTVALVFWVLHPGSSLGEDGESHKGYESAVVIDAETGRTLFEDRSHLPRRPASTVKTMLELIVMEGVREGRVSLDDSVATSAKASKVGGSQVFLKEGEVFSLRDLMKAIVIHSANDACTSVAEHLAGSEERFVTLMNRRAGELGLEDTRFVNVHGLDKDGGPVSSARDLARLARELIEYPRILEWSSRSKDSFRDGRFILRNRNQLVGVYPGMDGLKTGYTRRAGFCLVATAVRDDLRLISVVMGAPTEKMRFSETVRLLNRTFDRYRKVPIVRKGERVGEIRVVRGRSERVALMAKTGCFALLEEGEEGRIRRFKTNPDAYPAPIKNGETLGSLIVSLGDSVLSTVELVANREVPRMTTWEWVRSWL